MSAAKKKRPPAPPRERWVVELGDIERTDGRTRALKSKPLTYTAAKKALEEYERHGFAGRIAELTPVALAAIGGLS